MEGFREDDDDDDDNGGRRGRGRRGGRRGGRRRGDDDDNIMRFRAWRVFVREIRRDRQFRLRGGVFKRDQVHLKGEGLIWLRALVRAATREVGGVFWVRGRRVVVGPESF